MSQKNYTIEDIYALPDGKRAELIDGRIYYRPRQAGRTKRSVWLCPVRLLLISGSRKVIEIVSPSSRPRDYIKKMMQYCTAGVREYWIVDPEKRMVMVYRFEAEQAESYSFGEDIPVGIFEGLSLKAEL